MDMLNTNYFHPMVTKITGYLETQSFNVYLGHMDSHHAISLQNIHIKPYFN